MLLRYADSVGTNYEQRGMGCVQPADRYFLKITPFTQVLSSVSQAYSENPADFKPLTTEEMARIKAEKRQKDQVLQFFSGEIEAKFHPSG